MNFAQQDIEQTLDLGALQHETTLNDIGHGLSRTQKVTKRH